LTGSTRDKRVEALLLHFLDDTLREEFYQVVREILKIYDILSPDEYLRPYIDDYELAAEMYALLREKYDNRPILDREFSRKTAELVREHTQSSPIRSTREIYEINEHLLKKLEENRESDTEHVFNLVNLLERIDGVREPYLIPIGEKAASIAERFKERQDDTAEALEKLKQLIAQVEAARKERAAKNMSVEVFTVYWIFKQEGLENPEEEANLLEPVLRENPHYKISELHRRQIRQALYIPLVKSQVFKNNIIGAKDTAENIIKALTHED
jgi:type I restriction enzyme R subunit